MYMMSTKRDGNKYISLEVLKEREMTFYREVFLTFVRNKVN